jgi:hypothetical protein
MTTTPGPPEFDEAGRQTGGDPLSMATSAAIAKYRAVDYLRLRLARETEALEQYTAAIPAGELNAYVAATDLIRAGTDGRIAAIEERRADRIGAAHDESQAVTVDLPGGPARLMRGCDYVIAYQVPGQPYGELRGGFISTTADGELVFDLRPAHGNTRLEPGWIRGVRPVEKIHARRYAAPGGE